MKLHIEPRRETLAPLTKYFDALRFQHNGHENCITHVS